MSRLLINENPLQVLPTLACAVGLSEAIVLQQVHYWLNESRHFYDGQRWIYNSVPSWQKQFPFWSESTIKRALLGLEKRGVLVSANYNRDPRDHTKWYSIDYDVMKAIEEQQKALNDASGQNDPMEQVKMTRWNGAKCPDAQGQKDPMQEGNMTRPLPEITTEITTENKNTLGASANAAPPTGVSGSGESSGKPISKKPEYSLDFELVWTEYPKRAGGNPKATAYKHWKARIAEGTTPADLRAGVQRYAAFIRATGKLGTEYVKQAATFFGPDRHFEESWTPPAAAYAPGGARGMPNSGFREQDYGSTRTKFLLQGNKS